MQNAFAVDVASPIASTAIAAVSAPLLFTAGSTAALPWYPQLNPGCRQFLAGTELRPLITQYAGDANKPKFPTRQDIDSLIKNLTPGPPRAVVLSVAMQVLDADAGEKVQPVAKHASV